MRLYSWIIGVTVLLYSVSVYSQPDSSALGIAVHGDTKVKTLQASKQTTVSPVRLMNLSSSSKTRKVIRQRQKKYRKLLKDWGRTVSSNIIEHVIRSSFETSEIRFLEVRLKSNPHEWLLVTSGDDYASLCNLPVDSAYPEPKAAFVLPKYRYKDLVSVNKKGSVIYNVTGNTAFISTDGNVGQILGGMHHGASSTDLLSSAMVKQGSVMRSVGDGIRNKARENKGGSLKQSFSFLGSGMLGLLSGIPWALSWSPPAVIDLSVGILAGAGGYGVAVVSAAATIGGISGVFIGLGIDEAITYTMGKSLGVMLADSYCSDIEQGDYGYHMLAFESNDGHGTDFWTADFEGTIDTDIQADGTNTQGTSTDENAEGNNTDDGAQSSNDNNRTEDDENGSSGSNDSDNNTSNSQNWGAICEAGAGCRQMTEEEAQEYSVPVPDNITPADPDEYTSDEVPGWVQDLMDLPGIQPRTGYTWTKLAERINPSDREDGISRGSGTFVTPDGRLIDRSYDYEGGTGTTSKFVQPGHGTIDPSGINTSTSANSNSPSTPHGPSPEEWCCPYDLVYTEDGTPYLSLKTLRFPFHPVTGEPCRPLIRLPETLEKYEELVHKSSPCITWDEN